MHADRSRGHSALPLASSAAHVTRSIPLCSPEGSGPKRRPGPAEAHQAGQQRDALRARPAHVRVRSAQQAVEGRRLPQPPRRPAAPQRAQRRARQLQLRHAVRAGSGAGAGARPGAGRPRRRVRRPAQQAVEARHGVLQVAQQQPARSSEFVLGLRAVRCPRHFENFCGAAAESVAQPAVVCATLCRRCGEVGACQAYLKTLAGRVGPARPTRCGASSASVTSATATAACDAAAAGPAPAPAPARRASTSAAASGSSTGRNRPAAAAVALGRSSAACAASAARCRLGGACAHARASAAVTGCGGAKPAAHRGREARMLPPGSSAELCQPASQQSRQRVFKSECKKRATRDQKHVLHMRP